MAPYRIRLWRLLRKELQKLFCWAFLFAKKWARIFVHKANLVFRDISWLTSSIVPLHRKPCLWLTRLQHRSDFMLSDFSLVVRFIGGEKVSSDIRISFKSTWRREADCNNVILLWANWERGIRNWIWNTHVNEIRIALVYDFCGALSFKFVHGHRNFIPNDWFTLAKFFSFLVFLFLKCFFLKDLSALTRINPLVLVQQVQNSDRFLIFYLIHRVRVIGTPLKWIYHSIGFLCWILHLLAKCPVCSRVLAVTCFLRRCTHLCLL